MNKRYAIFDFDGTLVDSMPYWQNLACEYLLSKGIDFDKEKTSKAIQTMTMTQSAEYFISEFKIEGTPASVSAEINALMDKHYENDVSLKKGVKEYIEKLYSSGVRLCVASATDKELVAACLKRLMIYEFFEFVLSCEDVGVGKDKPDIFLKAASLFSSNPNGTAVYEDAIYAIKTAKRAGFYTIAVYDLASKSHWQEIEALADEIIYSWQ